MDALVISRYGNVQCRNVRPDYTFGDVPHNTHRSALLPFILHYCKKDFIFPDKLAKINSVVVTV